MKKSLMIFSGIAVVMVGLGFVMPAVAQWRDTGALPGISVGLLLLGLALMLGGGGGVVYASTRRNINGA